MTSLKELKERPIADSATDARSNVWTSKLLSEIKGERVYETDERMRLWLTNFVCALGGLYQMFEAVRDLLKRDSWGVAIDCTIAFMFLVPVAVYVLMQKVRLAGVLTLCVVFVATVYTGVSTKYMELTIVFSVIAKFLLLPERAAIVVPVSSVVFITISSFMGTIHLNSSMLYFAILTVLELTCLFDWRKNSLVTRREEEYRMLLDGCMEGLVLLRDGVVIDACTTFETLVQIPVENIRGSNLVSCVDGRGMERLQEKLAPPRSGAASGTILFEALLNVGIYNKVPVEISINHGKGGYTVCGFRDVTHRKRVEDALIDAKEAQLVRVTTLLHEMKRHAQQKAAFLAGMCHEIRNQSSVILGMTSTLQASFKDMKEQHVEPIRVIAMAASSLRYLLDDMLHMEKLEAGMVQVEQVTYDVSTVACTATIMMREQAMAKQIELTVFVHPDVPLAVVGDPYRYNQILVNLLSNAVKFTPHGGVVGVVVSARRREGNVVVIATSVTDNGIGIRKEHLEKIFSPFQQATSSTTRNYGGTGLGLSISKKLAEKMGGGIKVTSIFTKGSAFAFHVKTQMTVAGSQVVPLQRPCTALVIYSHDDGRQVLARTLSGWGLIVAERSNVDGAGCLMERGTIHVVVVEHTLLEAAAAAIPPPSARVLYMVLGPCDELPPSWRKCRMMSKPPNPNELRRAISSHPWTFDMAASYTDIPVSPIGLREQAAASLALATPRPPEDGPLGGVVARLPPLLPEQFTPPAPAPTPPTLPSPQESSTDEDEDEDEKDGGDEGALSTATPRESLDVTSASERLAQLIKDTQSNSHAETRSPETHVPGVVRRKKFRLIGKRKGRVLRPGIKGVPKCLLISHPDADFRKQVDTQCKELAVKNYSYVTGHEALAAWEQLISSKKNLTVLVLAALMEGLDGVAVACAIREFEVIRELTPIHIMLVTEGEVHDSLIQRCESIGADDVMSATDPRLPLILKRLLTEGAITTSSEFNQTV